MSTWNSSRQRELTTNPLSGKLGADHDPRASRASLASAAPARLGPQNNWPRPAIVVAAAKTWAILMIRLTVTQFILARAARRG